MARPIKEGMDYFPHDTDSSNDEKIEALRGEFGNDGYAMYFILLERIYKTDTGSLDMNKIVIKKAIIKHIGVSEDVFNNILEFCFEIELFDRNTYEKLGLLTSNGIRKRRDEVNKQREKWRKRKVFQKENSNKEKFSNEKISQIKEKESKEKESKEKESKEDGCPLDNQLTDKGQHRLSKDKLSKDNIYSDLVKNYPGKKIKSVRDKKLPKILEEYSVEEIKRCINRYSEECKGKEKQFILNESTFWNGRYIDYLDKNYQEENKNIEDVNIGQVIEIEDLLEGRV